MSETRPGWADLIAGLSIAGLLLPEAVAYAGLANVPPQAGVVALFAGLLVYGLLGSSRFAVVSATSSSAAVFLAATSSTLAGPVDPGARLALGAGLVLLAGLFFVIAAAARLGALSSLIAKPVLRGFAMGLALTIVLKQCPKLFGVQTTHGDFFRLIWELGGLASQWNWRGAAIGLGALALLYGLGKRRALPAALIVIALGIGLDLAGLSRAWQVPAVGAIELNFVRPHLPTLDREQWLRMGELAFALALILYAESYGSIRTFALRHGDATAPNRDLLALGAANLLSGLMQGMPVGAGYSASSANETAGARSRAAGLIAGAVVALAVFTLLPWIAHIPEPVLAAIVIHAVGHTLNPAAIKPYFQWQRDRVLVLLAFAAVLLLGVLDGLLAAVAASIVMLLRDLAATRLSWLGRLGDGHDYVDIARHPEALPPADLLIARPEGPVFFGNADAVFEALRARVLAGPELKPVVLSLEESSDLDATSLEALIEFASWMHSRGQALILARVKDRLRDLLLRAQSPALPPAAFEAWSVDDAVRRAQSPSDH